MERHRGQELALSVGVGILAIALASCVPAGTEAYYQPFNDTIVYLETPSPETRLHEQEHQRRANETGRLMWGLEYMFSPEFRCAEETAANVAANIAPIDDHIACDVLKK